MIFSIDRIEDGFAFLESDSRDIVLVSESELPEGARDGDCLEALSDGSYIINEDETARRRSRNRDLFKSLLEDR